VPLDMKIRHATFAMPRPRASRGALHALRSDQRSTLRTAMAGSMAFQWC
jgi:hypothetical protein